MEARKVCLYSLALALLLLISGPAYSIVYVSKSGNDANDGLSWATSKLTIQAGVTTAAAQTDKTVWVAVDSLPPPALPAQPVPIPYVENVVVPANVAVYGGFRGDEVASSPPPVRTLSTVVRPAGAGPIFVVGTCVIIDGFTIENGQAPQGAGIFVSGTAATISNDIIRNNNGVEGAAIYASGAALNVKACQFSSNQATNTSGGQAAGASIYMVGGLLAVTESTFTDESARVTTTDAGTANGGAIYATGLTMVRLDRNVFANCTCGGTTTTVFALGGALYLVGEPTIITNCLFNACQAKGSGDPFPAYGGAIYFHNPAPLSVVNNTFVHCAVTPHAGAISDADRAYGQGAALFLTGAGSTATLTNNIIAYSRGTAVVNEGLSVRFNYNLLWHNAGGDIYGFNFPVENPPISTDNNIMKDPQFLKGDPLFHITFGSPAKNAGLNAGSPNLDIDDEARPFGAGVDIGADEFVDTDNDGGADVDPREVSPGAIVAPEADGDGDGIYTPYDNCPANANPQQLDSNGDGIGDVCEGIPEVFYVDGSVAVSGNGLSWATAFKTIQEGIDAADLHNQTNADGATAWAGVNPQVWVRKGTYNENPLIWHGVAVYGSFNGDELPPSLSPNVLSGRLPLVNVSQIDGGGLWSTVVIAHLPQDRYLTGSVKTQYGSLVPTIDGFLITNGAAEIGGGVSVYKEVANVSANRIQTNTAALGGGIYFYRSNGIVGDGIGPGPGNILMGDTTVKGNTAAGPVTYAGYGGGVYAEKGGPVLFANIITGNAAFWGGGVAARGSAPSLVENLIGCLSAPNVASGTAGDGKGGGVYLDLKSWAAFEKNTIVSNLAAGAAGQGGGVWFDNSDFYMNLTIDAFNTAAAGALIWANSPNAQVVLYPLCYITNSDFYPIAANSFFGIPNPTVGGPLPCPLTNLAVDPLFVNPGACDYNLQAGSPLRLLNGDVVGAFQDEDPPVSISEAKKLGNGVTVTISDGVVSAAFPDCFYIEDAERTSGIKVLLPEAPVAEGQTVDVKGVMTTLDNERQIISATVTATAGPIGSIAPLGMACAALGGGAVAGLTTELGAGVSNIGLLVKICGKVASTSASPYPSFVLEDGSGAAVKVRVPAESCLPEAGSNVVVTGISGTAKGAVGYERLLRCRRAGDISVPQ